MKFLIIFSVFILSSCDQLLPPIISNHPNDAFIYGVPAPLPVPLPVPVPTTPSTNIGVVKCNNVKQTQTFNLNLRKFLSTNINPNQLGNHSCTKDRAGGVFFRGQIKTNKPFSPNGINQDLIIDSENSYLKFHFETYTANTPNAAPIRLRYTYGSIQNRSATLTFEDHKGEVHLDGQIITHSNGKILFTGNLRFKNYQTWESKTPGYSGNLGFFVIEACKFFQC